MKKFFDRHRVFGAILLFVLICAFLCVYLWMQDRYNDLATKKAILVREVSALRGEVVRVELENRELASLERIQQVARKMGLGYGQVPRKLKKEEGEK